VTADNDGHEARYGADTYVVASRRRRMNSATRDAKYHVVCRECSVERLFEAGADATGFRRAHTDETGHRVVVGRL